MEGCVHGVQLPREARGAVLRSCVTVAVRCPRSARIRLERRGLNHPAIPLLSALEVVSGEMVRWLREPAVAEHPCGGSRSSWTPRFQGVQCPPNLQGHQACTRCTYVHGCKRSHTYMATHKISKSPKHFLLICTWFFGKKVRVCAQWWQGAGKAVGL